MTTILQQPAAVAWRMRLLELPRLNKRLILVAFDFLLLALALWILLSIRYNQPYFPDDLATALLLLAGPAITVAAFALSGLYRLVTRYLGYRGHTRILWCIALAVPVWALVVFMAGQQGIPRSVVLGYGVLATLFIAGSREVASMMLESAGIKVADLPGEGARTPVIIFGAGHLGVELLEALRRASDRHPVAFVDAEPSLWRQYIAGMKVHSPDRLVDLIERHQVKEVLVALPDEQRRQRRRILNQLQSHPVQVKILPPVEDIASGRVSVSDLRPLEVDDLLGRDKVPPDVSLLARKTRGRCIMVTGAGGSIGSEIVRQLIKQSPRRIVLLDISEAALYQIEDEVTDVLAGLGAPVPEIVAVLGSVLDSAQMHEVIAANRVEIIYHAAAYKHVPIVEHNPVFGLLNNTFGAVVVAECAQAAGVELMVLISTDKAVRPTNIMGASKRLAELVLQAAAAKGGDTTFTMVRFGNVLDSSGSVVKKFRRQIRGGGPVTVTHPDIIRYFMSIPEAAELVIQAGAMAEGGDLFLLDMGEPVRIDDLARLMIRLSGLEVRSGDNPDGDISISYTGLRPGEKLYEELLIGDATKATEHPRIWRSDEAYLTPEELARELKMLRAAMEARDFAAMEMVLARTVEGYRPKKLSSASADSETPALFTPLRTLH
jgi:FlaA1/EpsC-like NDP-sugar epimerase